MVVPPIYYPEIEEKKPIANTVSHNLAQKKRPSDHKSYVPTRELIPSFIPANWQSAQQRLSINRDYNRRTRRNRKLLEWAKWTDAFAELISTDKVFALAIEDMYRLKRQEQVRELGIRRPTGRSFRAALILLTAARSKLTQPFLQPSIGVDSEGNLHIHWVKGSKEMTLVTPSRKISPYLYHEIGKNYGVERNLSAGQLKDWMEWLISDDEGEEE